MEGDWAALEKSVSACRACGLCENRTHPVLGEGDPHASILFVGEGPGREEDLSGRPFVGPAGQLLDKMLLSIGLQREEVYIANIVKCRPPNNRTPEEEEALCCLPFLRQQFRLLRPKIIVCLGATAARHIYSPSVRITRDRGRWLEKKGVFILPTYHPAALLRDSAKKREAYADLLALKAKIAELGLESHNTTML